MFYDAVSAKNRALCHSDLVLLKRLYLLDTVLCCCNSFEGLFHSFIQLVCSELDIVITTEVRLLHVYVCYTIIIIFITIIIIIIIIIIISIIIIIIIYIYIYIYIYIHQI